MIQINNIKGNASDHHLAGVLHELEHRDRVEYVHLNQDDMKRHRMRVTTDRGTECAIALQRTESLTHHAVLLIEKDRAVVVRMKESYSMAFEPCDVNAALELAYLAGNMHWHVHFGDGALEIEVSGEKQRILDRVAPLIRAGKVKKVDAG